MKCVKCNAEIKAGARFCDCCGAPQPVGTMKCIKCGAELKTGARFCDCCGSPQQVENVQPQPQNAPQEPPPPAAPVPAQPAPRCVKCDVELPPGSLFCDMCGASQQPGAVPPPAAPQVQEAPPAVTQPQAAPQQSPKSIVVYRILALLLGGLGIHNFYAGYTGKGVVQLLLCCTGISSLWALIELFAVRNDAQGRPMSNPVSAKNENAGKDGNKAAWLSVILPVSGVGICFFNCLVVHYTGLRTWNWKIYTFIFVHTPIIMLAFAVTGLIFGIVSRCRRTSVIVGIVLALVISLWAVTMSARFIPRRLDVRYIIKTKFDR